MQERRTSVARTPTDWAASTTNRIPRVAAGTPQHVEIRPESGREGHTGRRDDAGAPVRPSQHVLHGNGAGPRRDGADLDPEAPQIEPRVNIVRVFELGAEDDVVARAPIQTRRHHVEAFRHVLGERDLVGVGMDQRREPLAGFLDELEELRLVPPFEHPMIQMGVHGLAHTSREDAACRDIHVRQVLRCGEVPVGVDQRGRRRGGDPFDIHTTAPSCVVSRQSSGLDRTLPGRADLTVGPKVLSCLFLVIPFLRP